MKITKFGHSCLLVEENGVRIIIDPGDSSGGRQDNAKNIDAIIITHEHADHFLPLSVQKLLKNNPNARVITNADVGKILASHHFPFEIVGDGEAANVNGLKIEGSGKKHALILKTIPIISNTGYFIGDRFYYGGDALDVPKRKVEILAFPAVAPWMNIREGIEFGLKVKPKMAFPVHDAILKHGGPYYRIAEQEFARHGIKWMILKEDVPLEV